MSILDRISTLLRANINDLIERAEDPEKVIKQLIEDMHSQLLQVKTQVAAAIADEKQLYQRYQDNQEEATEWQRKAELAVERGQDDLAREALQRRNAFQQTAGGFKEQYENQARQVAILKDALHALEAKVDEAEAKKHVLIARSRRARTESQVRTTLSGLDTSGALEGFERIEEKVNPEEARASALAELDHDTADERFDLLESASEVDRQLAELKARKSLGGAEPKKELGPGEPEGESDGQSQAGH
jgi:phage shock protein A